MVIDIARTVPTSQLKVGQVFFEMHSVRFRSAILIPKPNPIPSPSRSEPIIILLR